MKSQILKICFASILALGVLMINSCSKDNNGGSFFDQNGGGTGSGTGGSLARFTISNDYMYAVDNNTLKTFSLASPSNPKLVNSLQIGFNIETIYAVDSLLFIGSRDAMYIYGISNPSTPLDFATASHVRACDPVVAEDKYAYVTVRSQNNGSPCGGNTNSLIIYDITTITQPVLINTLNLSNPHGLGIKQNVLYVCDDKAGLKVLDVKDPLNIQTMHVINDGNSYQDVIIIDNILYCMLNNGFIIYDITQSQEAPIKLAEFLH